MTNSLQRTRPMTVGELSRRTGVPIKNLRQYTDWGLINTIGRSPTNYRLYEADALWCVQFIGQLRGLGLTVAEIRELTGTDTPISSRLAELLYQSRARLARRIADMRQTLRRIDEFETAAPSRVGRRRQRLLGGRSPLRRKRLTLTPGADHTVATVPNQRSEVRP